MRSKEPTLSLRDIADAIDSIQEFTQGMDFEAFRADSKTIAAVERKLLVISEAAVRLGDQAEALCPSLPWRDIRGIGNWLRHQIRGRLLFGLRLTPREASTGTVW